MRPRRREIQSWNKLHGARVMQSALRAMRIPRTRKGKPLIHVLLPFRAVRASNRQQLEQKIKMASKGKKCERVFIRGNPIKSIKKERVIWWIHAPRGHLNVKTARINWDVKPNVFAEYEFLLHVTRPREQIEKEGILYLNVGAHSAVGNLEFEGRRIPLNLGWRKGKPPFIGKKIEGLGELGQQLTDFIKAIVQQPGWSNARLRFVKWKGEKGVEFFDFRKEE